ncbi:uncharacterized protein K460DRAFT_355888 [Cucurbitaria berberidis CBS 394.84]|uniref:Uncharacterized protein n=1 Tax=Cucurbitaria berberidis CBS 394.84 TaxID=1168544 RepID=A0A9P4GJC0_9PLEO|nr:uncharacterized protein K460DRAFT_355888 [Cucurbitaria berberidis CBS 394.84]KAF1846175.1 hypothetical protein K460DRAFT_355888 [Cucurbitaria berberidis CBS 394.84]
MAEQVLLSVKPEPTQFAAASFIERNSTWPHQQSRKSSTSSNATLRELLGSWGILSSTPPSCSAVSFSSWTRFTASTTSTTPPGELKASTLCKGSGLSASYDPPASEWAYLGADQPVGAENPEHIRRTKNRRQRKTASWTTASSPSDGGRKSEPIQFRKQELKQVNTSSQLTTSIKMSAAPAKQLSKTETMMKRLGIEGMKCEELPSAFDSDSEEEDE